MLQQKYATSHGLGRRGRSWASSALYKKANWSLAPAPVSLISPPWFRGAPGSFLTLSFRAGFGGTHAFRLEGSEGSKDEDVLSSGPREHRGALRSNGNAFEIHQSLDAAQAACSLPLPRDPPRWRVRVPDFFARFLI